MRFKKTKEIAENGARVVARSDQNDFVMILLTKSHMRAQTDNGHNK